MKQVTIRLPDFSIDQIEELKKYYQKQSDDNLEPTTTDIIRRSINLTFDYYQLPDYTFAEIEMLKDYYKDLNEDVTYPTTSDILRKAIHYTWCDSRITKHYDC